MAQFLCKALLQKMPASAIICTTTFKPRASSTFKQGAWAMGFLVGESLGPPAALDKPPANRQNHPRIKLNSRNQRRNLAQL